MQIKATYLYLIVTIALMGWVAAGFSSCKWIQSSENERMLSDSIAVERRTAQQYKDSATVWHTRAEIAKNEHVNKEVIRTIEYRIANPKIEPSLDSTSGESWLYQRLGIK